MVNLSFRVSCDSKLSDLHSSMSQKMKKKNKKSGWWADETLILGAIFVTLTEKLSVIKNDTRGL